MIWLLIHQLLTSLRLTGKCIYGAHFEAFFWLCISRLIISSLWSPSISITFYLYVTVGLSVFLITRISCNLSSLLISPPLSKIVHIILINICIIMIIKTLKMPCLGVLYNFVIILHSSS